MPIRGLLIQYVRYGHGLVMLCLAATVLGW
jgi:hypothetical protein